MIKKIIFTGCVTYTVFSLLNHSLHGISRLFMIPLAIFIIKMSAFVFKNEFLSTLKTQTSKQTKTRNELVKIEKQNKRMENMRDYDTHVKPLYTKGRALFNTLMKQRKIRNYELADLISLINQQLGVHLAYYKNYKFPHNSAKEVYVKMKNFNLDEYNWEIIIERLEFLALNEPLEPKNKESQNEEMA